LGHLKTEEPSGLAGDSAGQKWMHYHIFAMLGFTGLPSAWQLKNPQLRRRCFLRGAFRLLILILILIEMENEDYD
jgi:hypothetical protein